MSRNIINCVFLLHTFVWLVLGYDIKQIPNTFVYNGQIADFGDFDGNGQLDAITYHQKGNDATICVFKVSNRSDKPVILATAHLQGNVAGAVGVDINLDSALDVLVIIEESKHKYRLLTFYQEKKSGLLVQGWDSTKETNGHNQKKEQSNDRDSQLGTLMKRGEYEYSSIHPLVLDINGDGFVDLFCQTEDKRLFVWTNYGGAFLPYLLENVPSCYFEGTREGYVPSPHSSAFVDINGDCRADLILLVQHENKRYLQIWETEADNNRMKYIRNPNKDIVLPTNHGQVSFADFNGDGTIDIVVPYCNQLNAERSCIQGSRIFITFNHQKPFCSYIWNNPNSDMCRKATELCTKSDFAFHPVDGLSSVDISLPVNVGFKDSEGQLMSVSLGDLNNNGYPDVIVLGWNLATLQPVVCVYRNVENNESSVVNARSFVQSAIIEVTEPDIRYIRVAAVDLFEDGITEVGIFTSKVSIGNDSIARFYTTVNEKIGLFMKAMVRGVAENETPSSVNVLSTGSNVNGAVFKITVIDVYGAKSPRCSTIRPQSAHSPLLPPYSMFGLGKTNNYVEEFYLGMPSTSKSYSNMWISIIPNCSVIAIPHRLLYPNEWTLKLSLSPSKDIYKILVATLICLVSLGVIIVGFDIKEKREDSEQEKGFRQKFIIN
ncbi:T-cell immunomodulatory protein-like protein precursor, putative [Babesia bigemina]|uniref:T-cell immunomodulatory protein-like protein, putative n=1 Tax=Babesia bigemina TaxID=5866 RepID=A0A061D061_BABBI|nr:T-cell immunomodulatory protein-like protein precursor, putative [Babesia bigemina]CDR94221.1 T-cell immunomodulatory protein-like protein precursor, putative [Babesia bigemina]|eukprot:XP_012766407.1 T-cell immunomodulatory protein-like protein precursor, putative [Babesia bigemina]